VNVIGMSNFQFCSSVLLSISIELPRVTGFQIRAINLPDTLENRLIDIQLRQLDATLGEQVLILDSIYAKWNRTVLELETARQKLATQLEQTTTVQRTAIVQERNRIEEETNRAVTRIEEERDRNVTLYNKETDLLVQALDLDSTRVTEATRREVDAVVVGSETNITLYNQETANLGLEYDERVVLIEEQTLQNVSRILSDLEQEEQAFYAAFETKLAAALRDAEVARIDANLEASLNTTQARATALEGRDSLTLLAEVIANATLTSVEFMDVNTPDDFLLSEKSNTTNV
jgi:hypothetical protein